MAAERQKVVGRAEETILAEAESDAAAFEGRMQRSRELRKQAEQLAAARLEERVLLIRARGAVYEAAMGDINRARATLRAIGDPPSAPALEVLATAAVLTRDDRHADALLTRAQSGETPPGRLIALLRVLHDVERGDGSALDRLPPADIRDVSRPQAFRPVYVRGLIYLHSHDGARAALEFQRILDHRGAAVTSPLYSLAHVQLARAHTLNRDLVRAQHAINRSLGFWKNADPDVPILRRHGPSMCACTGAHDDSRHLASPPDLSSRDDATVGGTR